MDPTEIECLNAREIREYVYSFARENELQITEWRDRKTKKPFWCHIERPSDHRATAAIAPDQNSALLMAFINFLEPRCNFVPKEISRRRKNT